MKNDYFTSIDCVAGCTIDSKDNENTKHDNFISNREKEARTKDEKAYAKLSVMKAATRKTFREIISVAIDKAYEEFVNNEIKGDEALKDDIKETFEKVKQQDNSVTVNVEKGLFDFMEKISTEYNMSPNCFINEVLRTYRDRR